MSMRRSFTGWMGWNYGRCRRSGRDGGGGDGEDLGEVGFAGIREGPVAGGPVALREVAGDEALGFEIRQVGGGIRGSAAADKGGEVAGAEADLPGIAEGGEDDEVVERALGARPVPEVDEESDGWG